MNKPLDDAKVFRVRKYVTLFSWLYCVENFYLMRGANVYDLVSASQNFISSPACRKVNKSKLSNDYFHVYYFFAPFLLRTTLKEIKNLLNHRDHHCLTIHFIRMFRPRSISFGWLARIQWKGREIRRESVLGCVY